MAKCCVKSYTNLTWHDKFSLYVLFICLNFFVQSLLLGFILEILLYFFTERKRFCEMNKKAMISFCMVDGKTLFILYVIYSIVYSHAIYIFFVLLPFATQGDTLIASIFTYGALNIYHRQLWCLIFVYTCATKTFCPLKII